MEMFIVKIGGSVIAQKEKKFEFNHEIMDNLSQELKKANQEVILVHGAGSFGHLLAQQYKLNHGFSSKEQLQGFSQTHEKVQELNSFVLSSLLKHNIHAVSIPPHAILELNDHKPIGFSPQIFHSYLKQGFTPLTFGDVVLDKKIGFSICSGDLLVRLLAEHFHPKKIIFILDEDGIFTTNPKLDRNAQLIQKTTLDELKNLKIIADKHADVTKGMEGKIETMAHIARRGTDIILVNGYKKNRLYNTLIGKETVGTFILGENK